MGSVMCLPFILLVLGIIITVATKFKKTGKVIVTVAVAAIASTVWVLSFLIIAFSSVHPEVYIVAAAMAIIAVTAMVICLVWGALKKKAAYIPIIALLMLSGLTAGGMYGYTRYHASIETVKADGGDLLTDYAPYYELTRVAELDNDASLKLSAADGLPKMDGATALYPVYSAFAKAVYPKSSIDEIAHYDSGEIHRGSSEVLNCSTTSTAYEKIVLGDADIIFVAGPSKEQEEFAKDNGVELIYTPIGKEAFVFFVNFKNPLEDLTVDEIKNIYSGKTKKWSELGVSGFGKIRAFQREEGSGSQTALIKLMGDVPLAEAPKEDVVGGMGGIITRTADYKNYKNAIGYSFRFYATEMVRNSSIKLLAVNGIAPTEENIRNGNYPVSSYFYAVTRSDASESTKKLLSWLETSEAKELIEKTGYTPIE